MDTKMQRRQRSSRTGAVQRGGAALFGRRWRVPALVGVLALLMALLLALPVGARTLPSSEAARTAAEQETGTPAAESDESVQDATATPAPEGDAGAADATGTPAAAEEGASAEGTATPAAASGAAEAAATAAPAAEGTLPGNPSITLVKVAEGLADPVNVASAPDGSGRVFVIERIGRIRIIQDGQLLPEPFLDIQPIVKIDFLEQGLLGLAFHPNYAENGRFFVYYIDWRTNGDSVLAEFAVSDDPNVADPDSARVLFTHDQPFVNHNGGTIQFGPDGYLYIAMGDGGLAGDPYRNAQDLSNFLGKILRIDVDVEEGSYHPYDIPADNPFQGKVLSGPAAREASGDGSYQPDARAEIWAYGLRNPWQFSFDSLTGDLYIADVGQGMWEEVNVQEADAGGGQNYGWPTMEGSHCYPEDSGCSPLGVLPVAEYSHEDGSCSITGVGSYRGTVSPSLDGIYFYSDYCSGKFWGLVRDEGMAPVTAELLDTELLITGAGADEAGELYVTSCTCDFARDYNPFENQTGIVWRLVATDQVPEGAETVADAPVGEATPEPAAEATPEPAAEGTAEPAPEGEAAGEAQVIQVSLVDGEIIMPTTIAAGLVRFEVTNDGRFDHNFEIEGQDVDANLGPDLDAGQSGTLEIELAAGEYYVYCPVGDHASMGMELTLVVE